MREKVNSRITILVLFLSILILSIWAGNRTIGRDRDSLSYAMGIQTFLESNEIILSREITFFGITKLISLFFRNVARGVFLVYAFIAVTLKIFSMYKNSKGFFISLLVYLSFFYILQEFNTIRSGVASAIFLWAYPDLKEANLKKYVKKIFIAFLFHYSSVFYLLIYLVNFKIFRGHLFFWVVFSFFFLFSGVAFKILAFIGPYLPAIIGQRLISYASFVGSGRATLAVVSLQRQIFNYAFLAISYFFKKRINGDNEFDFLSDLMIWNCAVFFITSCIPVLGSRISEMSSVILVYYIPCLISNLRKPERKLAVLCLLVLCLPVFIMYYISYY